MMSKLRLSIVDVTASERVELESLASRRKTAQALAMRARIVLGCASGRRNKEVAGQLGIDPVTVSNGGDAFWLTGLMACVMSLALGLRVRLTMPGSKR